MDFPPNYRLYLTDAQIKNYFPNLKKGKNFKFTSLGTDEYNCIAWASEITDEWVQLYDINWMPKVDSASYIGYFNRLGFKLGNNTDVEKGKLKIAIYISTDNGRHEFRHVARQLHSGKWTSKLGDWEDIEHDTPEILLGKSYGEKIIIMEKAI